MALAQQNYQSVKDALPPSDGKFYDVIAILYEDNICGGYKYRLGQYSHDCFHVDHNFYFQKDEFRNFNTQLKVVAWQPLPKCTIEQARDFIDRATGREHLPTGEVKDFAEQHNQSKRKPNKNESKDTCVKFNDKCDTDCIVHKLVTHNACLMCNSLRNSPYHKDDVMGKTDVEIEEMQKEIERDYL